MFPFLEPPLTAPIALVIAGANTIVSRTETDPKNGALFEAKTKFLDQFAYHVVVDDEKRFVTGQNQNSGHETAQRIMEIIEESS